MGYVYIIKTGIQDERGRALYKIGRSIDPERRIKHLKNLFPRSKPVCCIGFPTDYDRSAERLIHKKLESKKSTLLFESFHLNINELNEVIRHLNDMGVKA